jgi:hypothetical protein
MNGHDDLAAMTPNPSQPTAACSHARKARAPPVAPRAGQQVGMLAAAAKLFPLPSLLSCIFDVNKYGLLKENCLTIVDHCRMMASLMEKTV